MPRHRLLPTPLFRRVTFFSSSFSTFLQNRIQSPRIEIKIDPNYGREISLTAAIRAARIADGAFALHINVIDAANIVPRRISHGHVTVRAIPRRANRDERTSPSSSFSLLSFFQIARQQFERDRRNVSATGRLRTLLIYSSMVIRPDTGDRNRLAPSGSVLAHTRETCNEPRLPPRTSFGRLENKGPVAVPRSAIGPSNSPRLIPETRWTVREANTTRIVDHETPLLRKTESSKTTRLHSSEERNKEKLAILIGRAPPNRGREPRN